MKMTEKQRIKSPTDRMYRYEVWKLYNQFKLQKPTMRTLAKYMAEKWGGVWETHYRRIARMDLEALSTMTESDFFNKSVW